MIAKWDSLLEIFTTEQVCKLLTAVFRTVTNRGDMVSFEKKLNTELELIALNPIGVIDTHSASSRDLFNTSTVKLILDRVSVYRDLSQYAINIENLDNGSAQFLIFTGVAIDDKTHNMHLIYATNNGLTPLLYTNFPSYVSKIEKKYKLYEYTDPMELATALAKIVAEG